MATTHMATKKKQSGPQASRPSMPSDYGIPKDRKGLLQWSHVTGRMTEAMHYWVSTVDAEGRPHSTPVDGLWIDGALYFGGSPKTRRNRNLALNQAVCIHLESAMDVIILEGEARELREPDSALTAMLADGSKKKYGYSPPPEAFGAGGTFVFKPRLVLAWTQFPKDATRWQFDE
jgi:nitroimidazol reductase NimA-like FMN-containing flavoprotein (pyridoxamine 5'-phosphate oxidase superfamily)